MRRLDQWLSFLALLATTSLAVAAENVDEWFELKLLGQPAGWSHISSIGDVEITSSNETAFRLKRGAVEVAMNIQIEWVETADGAPLSMTMRQDMSGQRMTTIWTFKGDSVDVTAEQDGRRSTSTVASPKGTWHPVASLLRETARLVREGKTEIVLRTMQPDFGVKLVTVTSTRIGEGVFKDGEAEIPVTIWDVKNDAMPFTSTVKMNAEGRAVETTMQAPFGNVEMRLSTRAKALAAIEGGDGPELMDSLMVPVNRPIPDWQNDRTALFRLRAGSGEVPDLPSSGFQRMGTVEEDGTALLRVDLDHPSRASEEDRGNAEFLGSSVMIDPTDPEIVKLKDRALKGVGSGQAERAEALRRFVYEWISRKNYATVFASASETARTRTGDCSEHGVFLAALLRADGIPSRAASGAVYLPPGAVAEGPVFGWHMWTQAIIDGHWVDLDATLPVSYTVGHLLADTSAMTDSGGLSDQWNMLSLIGNLEVDVLAVDEPSSP